MSGRSQTSSQLGKVASGLKWTLVGEGCFAASQFILLMVLARLGSPSALGQYSLGLAISTPIIIVVSFHLRPAFVVESDPKLAYRHYVTLRMLGAPAAVVSCAIWALCATSDWDT